MEPKSRLGRWALNVTNNIVFRNDIADALEKADKDKPYAEFVREYADSIILNADDNYWLYLADAVVKQLERSKVDMANVNKVWRDTDGELYHEGCLAAAELQTASMTQVKLEELDQDDECEECSGEFLSGLTPVVDDDPDDEDPD